MDFGAKPPLFHLSVQRLVSGRHNGLAVDGLQRFFAYLATERGLSGCRLYVNAVRFLYLQVLEWPAFDVAFHIPKRAQRIPELMTRTEVAQIVAGSHNLKHRSVLMTCYGCG